MSRSWGALVPDALASVRVIWKATSGLLLGSISMRRCGMLGSVIVESARRMRETSSILLADRRLRLLRLIKSLSAASGVFSIRN